MLVALANRREERVDDQDDLSGRNCNTFPAILRTVGISQNGGILLPEREIEPHEYDFCLR